MKYLLDTNIFIASKNQLPFDVYPSFWSAMALLGSRGDFLSIKKVKEEIEKGKDELSEWIKASLPAPFFEAESVNTVTAVGDLSQWVMTHPIFSPAAKTEFLSVADSWLVAHAMVNNLTVVTFETSDPTCRRRVKIPDACRAFGVKFCALNDAFRALGIKI